MFSKKKTVQESFREISTHIDRLMLPDSEKRNLKGLLTNIKIRTGVA